MSTYRLLAGAPSTERERVGLTIELTALLSEHMGAKHANDPHIFLPRRLVEALEAMAREPYEPDDFRVLEEVRALLRLNAAAEPPTARYEPTAETPTTEDAT